MKGVLLLCFVVIFSIVLFLCEISSKCEINFGTTTSTKVSFEVF